MISSTVTSKGQTTLPKPVRLALALNVGDKLCYVVRDGEVRLLPMRPIRFLPRQDAADASPMGVEVRLAG